jgi:acetyltransferase
MKAVKTKRKTSAEAIRVDRRPILETMFAPRSVAVIGASETPGSVGYALMENLQSFNGHVFPINPNRLTILGQKAFPKIREVREGIDLAVIATPAATVPGIVGECAAAGVKGAVIISAGFKECGPAGAELEQQILARRGKMRIIGPNCVGVMLPHIGLNATFAKPVALPGNIGFISQSGALCTAILDWSMSIQLGFQRIHFHRFDGRCELGRFDLSSWRRSPHAQHFALHGVGGRCALFSFRRARGRARETDHCHQSRQNRSCGESSRVAHWCAHWQR